MREFVLGLALVFGFMAITGCGGSGQNQNVAENADAKAIADYEAEQKARAESMKASPPAN